MVMSERIGIVTGGGDCPGLNAVKITEAVGRLKTVLPTGAIARTALALGICLGD
jgi:hypothetical protein